SLTFRLGDVPAGFEGSVRFNAGLSEHGEPIELVTKATLTFNTPKSKNQRLPLLENIFRRSTEDEERVKKTFVLTMNFISGKSELHEQDKEAVEQLAQQLQGLSIDQLFAIGHTDSEPLSGDGDFKDNYKLSEARARTISRYLGEILGLTPEQLSYMGAGPDKPIADNDTVEGRALNRRVEVKVYTDLISKGSVLTATKDHSGPEVVETFGERPGEGIPLVTEDDNRFDPPKFVLEMPGYDDKWLDSAEPGFKWLWPEPGYQPFTTAVNIAVQHAPGQKVTLLVNGEEAPALKYEGTLSNRSNTVAVSRWRAIEVSDGANVFEAVVQGKDGQTRLERTIHYAGPPVKAEVVPELSRLVANGRTYPVVAVRLTDANGIPARPGLVGGYAVTAPYEALRTMDGAFEGKAAYIIGYDGIAYLKLYPTTKTGEVVLTLKLRESQEEIRAWLDPELRDWIMVGIAEGTMGYNTLSGNAESLDEHDIPEDFYHDGRLAFFAKGKIKSSWLLTMAFDSEKAPYTEYDPNQSLDPDSFYTLYGDGTREGSEAITSRNIYIKIERKNFYALFGDYNTGLTVTELSRYSRSINGLRSEYKGERFEYNVFASETNQAFVRDEIRGDGTSGLYHLSRDNIVMNSESVMIEVRDRNRSEVVLSSTPMSRFVDYTIDYDNGTMFFKEPVDAQDFDLNPVYIVVEYESFDDSDNSMNYGGRAAVKVMDGKVQIGVTGIHEESVGKSGDLLGTDAVVKIGETTTVTAEAAQSTVEQDGASTDGSAITLKVEHEDEYFTGSAYARYIGEDFGLGQGQSSETGTRKLGFDTRIRTDTPFGYSLSGYRQTYLETGNERDLVDGKITLGKGNHSYYTGLRRITDRMAGGEEQVTDQLTAGGKWLLMNSRLVLKVDREQTLFESEENPDYPTRTTFGAEYKVSERLTVLGAQEISDSGDTHTETTRAGIRSNPWEGGTVTSTVERQYTDEEMRMFSSLGLKQTWQATKQWTLSAGFDKTTTIKDTTATHTAENSDYIAASLGAKYVMEKLTWNSRVEFHESMVLIKRNAVTAVSLEPRRGLGLSAGLHLFTEDGVSEDSKDLDLRLAAVYRPSKSRWTVLDRMDLIYEEFASESLDYDNWRIVNNFNLNYRVPHFWQVSVKYGNKYVNQYIQDKDYQGYTDLTGIEGRYNLTPIWDVGAHVDSLRSWHAGQSDNRLGLSLGYNPARNIWLSFGYNFKGFYDRDFSKADYTMNGVFIKFRLKFDQNSAQDAVRWITGH
ncbi:MAG: OmpA family protein, partial [Thermodesulfovibrionales bacterium]|nr:OmpA family protein [Thermodesulfovibrionales bacterium]